MVGAQMMKEWSSELLTQSITLILLALATWLFSVPLTPAALLLLGAVTMTMSGVVGMIGVWRK